MRKISLIVTTYNRPDTLELVLKSIAQQSISDVLLNLDKIEVLVADDGSGSETRELINKIIPTFPFELTHVWHEDNGFRLSAIRNLATSKSTGEYLIFIDGDCLVAPDFIEKQILLAEKGYFVGGNRALLSEKYTKHILENKDIAISQSGTFASVLAGLSGKSNKFFPRLPFGLQAIWRLRNSTNWQRPKGCNMAVWRDDYLKVNGFDEGFTGWGHEDADFLIRLLHAGVLIKDGRFAVPVFHLWHKLNSRENEAANKQKLLERLNSSIVRAEKGVDQYE